MTAYFNGCDHSRDVKFKDLLEIFGPDRRVLELPIKCLKCGKVSTYHATMNVDPYAWRKNMGYR